LTGKIVRKIAAGWAWGWINTTICDRLFISRPQLPYLKPVPDRGSAKNKDKSVPLTKDKRYEMARRKSVSSAYPGAGLQGDDLGIEGADLDFEPALFSASMPSVVMSGQPSMPSPPGVRPSASMMDMDSVMKSIVQRPTERQYDGSRNNNHWYPSQESTYM
jgi:hypothetical protein